MFFRKKNKTPTPLTPTPPVVNRNRKSCRIAVVDEHTTYEVMVRITGEHGVVLSDARSVLCQGVGERLRDSAAELAVLFDVIRDRNLAAVNR